MQLHEPVSVIMTYNADNRLAKPYRLKWKGRQYDVKEVCSHYTQVLKGVLCHIYSVACGSTNFIIEMNSQTLQWMISEIHDLEHAA